MSCKVTFRSVTPWDKGHRAKILATFHRPYGKGMCKFIKNKEARPRHAQAWQGAAEVHEAEAEAHPPGSWCCGQRSSLHWAVGRLEPMTTMLQPKVVLELTLEKKIFFKENKQ